MRTLKVKYDKTISDDEGDYYMVNVDALQKEVKQHVPEVDHTDFFYSSSGFRRDGRKQIQIVTGIRQSFGGKLIPLEVIPIL